MRSTGNDLAIALLPTTVRKSTITSLFTTSARLRSNQNSHRSVP